MAALARHESALQNGAHSRRIAVRHRRGGAAAPGHHRCLRLSWPAATLSITQAPERHGPSAPTAARLARQAVAARLEAGFAGSRGAGAAAVGGVTAAPRSRRGGVHPGGPRGDTDGAPVGSLPHPNLPWQEGHHPGRPAAESPERFATLMSGTTRTTIVDPSPGACRARLQHVRPRIPTLVELSEHRVAIASILNSTDHASSFAGILD